MRLRHVIVASAFLLAPSVCNAIKLEDVLTRLASTDESDRFSAALFLIRHKNPKVPEVVPEALQLEPFRSAIQESEQGRAAADFVLWKLAGKSVEPKTPASSTNLANVLLISIDTLRADHVGSYGYGRDTSPSIDALAASGALFTNAVSTSSWTLPAHMSMMTSLYPSFHKLEKGGRLGSLRLDDSEVTLAQLLKKESYSTAGLVTHPYLSAQWGFDKGFDVYRNFDSQAEAQTERAALWLEWHQFHVNRGMRKSRFFLFLHYIDPHDNYAPPPPYSMKYFPDYKGPLRPSDKMVTLFLDKPFATPEDFRYAVALYDGEINYVDTNLARLFAQLDQLGLRSSTLVLLTSDHGEEFKDHDSMGHETTLYREQLHVPFILSYPDQVVAGQKISGPVSPIDIMPTVLAILGRGPHEGAQGISLTPYLAMKDGKSPDKLPESRELFAELGPLGSDWAFAFRRKAVCSNGQKLIVNYLPAGEVTRELYALTEDPYETNNVYLSRKEENETRLLEARLEAFKEKGLAYKPGLSRKNQIEVDETTRERLRALGYVQ